MPIGDIFPWNANFETGIPLIDEQHKKLVQLINKLTCRLSSRSEASELNTIFAELADYAVYHFRSEEEIWHKFLPEDPWELEHKQTHERFVEVMLSLRAADTGQSVEGVIESIIKFLTHWLVYHILECDMSYAKTVLALQSGNTLQQAKAMSSEENGSMKALIEAILTMYDGITAQTLALKREAIAREKAEEKLRLSSKAIESTSDAICITDADFIVVDVNPSFCNNIGLVLEDVLGKNLKSLKSGMNEEKSSVIWDALLQQGHWVGEVSSSTKTDRRKVELLTLSAVKNTDGLVSNYVAIFSNISHLLKRQRHLEKLANHDKLTGLPNRLLLAERLGLSMTHADKNTGYLGICYLDLDGFKQVNDRLGHQAGDVVLQEVSRRLLNIVRDEDTVARLGGDEFVLLLGSLSSPDDYKGFLDRVLSEIQLPIQIGSDVASVGASVGVTIYPNDNSEPETLLQHADKAMYHAKKSGKSAYYLYQGV